MNRPWGLAWWEGAHRNMEDYGDPHTRDTRAHLLVKVGNCGVQIRNPGEDWKPWKP